MAKPKLAILTTVSMTIKFFYKGQIEALNRAGFETTVICAYDPELKNFIPNETAFIPVSFTRVINPLADIKVLWKLFRLFRREKYTLVQYSTLKASLLGSIASFLARTPIRIYLLWGLYYIGQTSIKRAVFKFFEKIICSLSTVVVPDSREVIDFLEEESVVKKTKCEFILNGSACGVDMEEYCLEKWQNEGISIRHKAGIPDESTVIGILGRLTGDKGVNEMVAAFVKLADEIENLFLLIVGGQEEKDKLRPETIKIMKSHPRIKCLGWQKTLLPCWAAIDIYCLPSYREGFPQSPLEAQAMKKPVICTSIMGCREAIVHNETGFLVEPKSAKALLEPLRRLIIQPELRKKMGEKGRERIKQMFDSKNIIQAMVQHRLKLLSEAG